MFCLVESFTFAKRLCLILFQKTSVQQNFLVVLLFTGPISNSQEAPVVM